MKQLGSLEIIDYDVELFLDVCKKINNVFEFLGDTFGELICGFM